MFSMIRSFLDKTFSETPPPLSEENRTSTDLSHRYPGIRNEGGNDCFLISILQMITASPSLQEIIQKACLSLKAKGNAKEKESAANLSAQIDRLLLDHQSHSQISQVSSSEIRRSMHTLRVCQTLQRQEDSSEVLQRLLSLSPESEVLDSGILMRIEEQKHLTPTGRAFEAYPNHPYSSLDAPGSKISHENALALSLDLSRDFLCLLADYQREKHRSSSQELHHFENELFIMFMQNYFCENSAAEPAWYFDPSSQKIVEYTTKEVTRKLINTPKELILTVKRFTQSGQKITTALPIQPSFTLAEELCPNGASYELSSFIVHHGSQGSSGHYVCYKKIAQRWFCFNDSSCSEITERAMKEALAISYFQQFILCDHTQSSCLITSSSIRKKSTPIPPPPPAPLLVDHSKIDKALKRKEDLKNIQELLQAVGSSHLDHIPKCFSHLFDEIIWIKDGMPDTYEYGKIARQKNPHLISSPSTPLLYPVGESLLSQLLHQQKMKETILLLDDDLEILHVICQSLRTPGASKSQITNYLNSLSFAAQQKILFQLAVRRGIPLAKEEIKDRYNFGEEQILKNCNYIHRVVEMNGQTGLYFPQETLEKHQLRKETLVAIREKNDFTMLPEEMRNTISRLVYFCYITESAIDKALQFFIELPSCIVSVEKGSTSIIDDVMKEMIEEKGAFVEREKELMKGHIKVISESSSLTPKQKEGLSAILRRNLLGEIDLTSLR